MSKREIKSQHGLQGTQFFGLIRPRGESCHRWSHHVPSVRISLQLIIIVSFFSVVCERERENAFIFKHKQLCNPRFGYNRRWGEARYPRCPRGVGPAVLPLVRPHLFFMCPRRAHNHQCVNPCKQLILAILGFETHKYSVRSCSKNLRLTFYKKYVVDHDP